MDAMLTELTGVTAYIDDIIVSGTTEEELLQLLICVLYEFQQYGFCLRVDKCAFL